MYKLVKRPLKFPFTFNEKGWEIDKFHIHDDYVYLLLKKTVNTDWSEESLNSGFSKLFTGKL